MKTTSLSSNTASSSISNITSASVLQVLVESLGVSNLQADIVARDSEQWSLEQRIQFAIDNYEEFPNQENQHDLIEQLEFFKRSLEKELKHAKKQQRTYQEQVREQNKKSYRSLKGVGRWALDSVKDFLGSSSNALVEKYTEIAASRQKKIDKVQAYLDSVHKDKFLTDNEIKTETANQLISVDLRPTNNLHQITTQTYLASTSSVVVNPIPDQLIFVNQPYSYSLDNVFAGNFSLLGATTDTQTTLPPWLSFQYKRIGSFRSKEALAIALQGNQLFVADEQEGLLILDVSTLSQPILLGNYSNGNNGRAYDVAVSGNTVFVADEAAGLLIIDVSIPSHPAFLSNYLNDGGIALSVAVAGNTVFLADDAAGLLILDVSNPTQPTLLGSYLNVNSGHALDVTVSNNMAFVANGNAGLLILDVSNPTQPTLLGSYPNINNGQAVHVAVSGNTVFVADSTAGLFILDISTPSNPILLANDDTMFAYDVIVSGNIVFLADQLVGPLVLDMRQATLGGSPTPNNADTQVTMTLKAYNSTTMLASTSFQLTIDQPPRYVIPTLLEQSLFPNNTLTIPIQSNVLFTNSGDRFLQLSIVSANNGQESVMPWMSCVLTPQELWTYNANGGVAQRVAISGNTVFVADGPAGIFILDASDPNNPILLGNYLISYANDVTVSGNTVFVAGYDGGLKILNASTPNSIALLGSYPNHNNGLALGVAISGNIAFVADGYAGLLILNVSNPTQPTLLSSYSSNNSNAYDVAVSGNRVFVVDVDAGLLILDMSIPSYLTLLGNYPNGPDGHAYDVAISGNTVFMADGTAGLLILDVSVPSQPTLLSSYRHSNNQASVAGVAVSGNLVFVADYSAGLLILDVSNTSHPTLLGGHPSNNNGLAWGVAVSGNTVFMAEEYGGLQILDIGYWELTANLPTLNDVGNYRLQVNATDPLGGTASSNVFTLRVEGPPIINGTIPAQHAKVNQAFNYFVPQGLFTDPNLDTISFRAALVDSDLPSWLSFNAFSAIFAGTPKDADTGNFTVVIFATDNIFPEPKSIKFNLIVNHVPTVGNPLATKRLYSNLPFTFTVPANTFLDLDSAPWNFLTYNASKSNNDPLPAWLTFNSDTLIFAGTPSIVNVGDLNLLVTAKNMFDDVVSAPLTLSILQAEAPVVHGVIDTQYAKINQAFSYFVPQGLFTDPNSAPMSFRAALSNEALPSWLNFNAFSAIFAGTPKDADTGNFTVVIFVTDNVYPYEVSVDFNLIVSHVPIVAMPIPTPPLLRINRPFNFTVPPETFFDPDSGVERTLRYGATQANNDSLPLWLQFNANTLLFSGTPNVTGELNVIVTAQNVFDDKAIASLVFSISPNVPPKVIQPISNLEASVGQIFRFAVSANTFEFLTGDTGFYNTSLMDGLALPAWLEFDANSQTFSGTPGRGDTDIFSARTLNIAVYAYNQPFVEGSYAMASFYLSVLGDSYWAVVIKAGGPIASVLSVLLAIYTARAFFINRCCKKEYREILITIGENFTGPVLNTPLKEVHSFSTRLLEENKSCCTCSRCCRDSSRELSDGNLPKWMRHNRKHNRLESSVPVPDIFADDDEIEVQVTNYGSVILERFKLRIADNSNSQSEQQEMKKLNTSSSSASAERKYPDVDDGLDASEEISGIAFKRASRSNCCSFFSNCCSRDKTITATEDQEENVFYQRVVL